MQGFTPQEAKGIFRSLYDFSFSSLIASRIIRILYALIVILMSIVGVILLIAFLATGEPAAILVGLIIIPIYYVIALIYTRVIMEVLVIFFRMGEDVHAVRYMGLPPFTGSPVSGYQQPGTVPGVSHQQPGQVPGGYQQQPGVPPPPYQQPGNYPPGPPPAAPPPPPPSPYQ